MFTGRIREDVPENVTPECSPDELLAAMADEHRRHTLRVLLEADTAVLLDDLAVEVARRGGSNISNMSDRERIEIGLYHVHLPMLADAGLIAYVASDEWVQLVYTGSPAQTALLSDMLGVEET